MTALFHAWRESADQPPARTGWNDLRHTPGLQAEASTRNNPLLARRAILDALRSLDSRAGMRLLTSWR